MLPARKREGKGSFNITPKEFQKKFHIFAEKIGENENDKNVTETANRNFARVHICWSIAFLQYQCLKERDNGGDGSGRRQQLLSQRV